MSRRLAIVSLVLGATLGLGVWRVDEARERDRERWVDEARRLEDARIEAEREAREVEHIRAWIEIGDFPTPFVEPQSWEPGFQGRLPKPR